MGTHSSLNSPRMRRREEALFGSGQPPRSARRLALGVLAAVALGLPASAAAAPPAQPYGKHDAGGFRNVLPPAQGANATLDQIIAHQATGKMPPHSDDQLGMYTSLAYAVPGLKRSDIARYYKDATFGVKPGHVEGTESPRDDVTIVRDNFGVPHIYGETRMGAMFGTGYATAEDRLFFMDVLRHAGRAELSSFAGGSNAAMDESVWADTPYREADLREQYDRAPSLYGRRGVLIQHDVQNYVAGINRFIAEACVNQTRLPGEYNLIAPDQHICLPDHQWTVNDVIATAALVAGIFGKGGGGELDNALTLQAAKKRFGKRKGRKVYADFASFNDPEAPTTVHGKSFPYGQPPKHRRGAAMPDRDSVVFAEASAPGGFAQSGDSASGAASASTVGSGKFPNPLEPLAHPHGASNALLVSGRETRGGHPVAVMGPQVSYFSPEILLEQDIHSPAKGGPPLDARGAAFPGTNLYVQLGHGRNYAWSATSAGQDITDTYAVKLCNPDGGKPTMESSHYRFLGQCLPFDVLTRSNSWQPTPADQTPPGSQTLTSLRTKVGIVIAKATIDGKPYAYTELRDTYFHEVDPSAFGFASFNNPRKMRTPQKFFRSACQISYTFNWFYINRHHIAYFNSGQNPERPRGVDPNLPTLAKKRFLWKDFDPEMLTEDSTPCREHPHVVDQRYLTSWNNRQAPDYNVGFSSIFRSDMLDERIKPDIRGDKKITLKQLIADMEDAGTVDLRGDRTLPWLLRVIRKRPVKDPDLARAVDVLAAWKRSGAHRIDRDRDGNYDDAEAVRIMDAWWSRLVEAQFKPRLGEELFDRVEGTLADDHNRTDHLGSAFQGSAYGIVAKDLRDVLGADVRGRYSREYCGRGKFAKCRGALLDSLRDALGHMSDAELYPDGPCELGTDQHPASPQACADSVDYRAVGGITQPRTPWINRPTFQQAIRIK
jgi:acyl-homoserine lactone acylase PvdQ